MGSETRELESERLSVHVDSVLETQLSTLLDRLTAEVRTADLRLVLFDTAHGADTTGLPPVKAVLTGSGRTKKAVLEHVSASGGQTAQVSATTEGEREASAETVVEPKKKSLWQEIRSTCMWVAVLAFVLFLLWGVYKLSKHL